VDHFPRYSAALGSAPRASFVDLAKADAIIVVGADLYEESGTAFLRIEESLKGIVTTDLTYNHGVALADLRLKERMDRKRGKLAVFAPVPVEQMKHAGISGVYALGSELELLSQISGAKSGNDSSNDAANKAGKLLSSAKNAVIVLGSYALSGDAEKVLNAAKKLGAKIMAIPAGANGAGLEWLNLVPGKNGRAFGSFDGLHAAFISGSLLQRRPKNLELLVVHTHALTGAALEADVVLPAATAYEKRGTTMNLEGRLLPLFTAAVDAGESVDLIGALQVMGDAMNQKLEIRGTRSAQRLLQDRFGLELDKVPLEGVMPAKKPEPKTAPINRADTANADTVLLAPRMWSERMLRSNRVRDAIGKDVLRLNARDAQKLSVRDGFSVELEVNGKARDVMVRVDDKVSHPTLPALEGEMAGTVSSARVAVMAGGDD
jgi:NADH-quinone oxidoreductase subunit G